MNAAAKAVMAELHDIVIAYGISDEYRYWSIRNLAFNPSDGFPFKFRLP